LEFKNAGERLFGNVKKASEQMTFRADVSVAADSTCISLPFRDITDDEYHGRVRGAQRFRSNELRYRPAKSQDSQARRTTGGDSGHQAR